MPLVCGMEKFGAKLRDLRIQRRMTLAEVGDIVKVSRSAVNQWELGLTTPDLAKLAELSRFFGVSIAEITGTPGDASSIDVELRLLDEATAHILRESFLASIRAMKPPKKL